ncbi:MAG: cbb3-type cytochrome c oxidase subunit 3 [Acidiferrobacterales bacterium]|jgi:cytochrome c oxidase cbb3-type subunit 4|nr:cbb3-type cytochrome c oxidase subunit 3 [Acidiferrobacterales bacterium]
MDAIMLHSIWTVVLLVVFVGIVIWAWSGKRKEAFRDAANLPLEDEEYVNSSKKSGDKLHG